MVCQAIIEHKVDKTITINHPILGNTRQYALSTFGRGGIGMRSDLDDRTQLLLEARAVNGVKVSVREGYEEAMQQMVEEELFRRSDTMFSEGYWWTPKGKAEAERVWRRLPVKKFQTLYRGHRRVFLELNGYKEEICRVIGPKLPEPMKKSGLRVREFLGKWLVDHPSGQKNETFKTADEAIEWALGQVG